MLDKLYDVTMSQFELIRHYIFINPNNINSDIHKCDFLKKIKKEHAKYYINNEKVIYWDYADIKVLLKRYDILLYELFVQLNVKYAALLADIGRYVILYFYGGVYSDLKCISNKKMISFLERMKNRGIVFVGESHPVNPIRVRNGNIISLCERHKLLHDTLQNIKYALLDARKNNVKGPKNIWRIGSLIYIDLFKVNKLESVVHIPLIEEGYIIFDAEIYSSRIVKWQSTFECLFKC